MQSTKKLRYGVVVTNFNYAPFIGECLDSIRLQTLGPTRLVVVDDASDDNSVAVLNAYLGTHNSQPNSSLFFKVMENDCNRGQLAGISSALPFMTDVDWIALCDADDVWPHDYIESLADLNLGRIDFMYSQPSRSSFTDATLTCRTGQTRLIDIGQTDALARVCGTYIGGPTSSLLVRVANLMSACEDLDFNTWRIAADTGLAHVIALQGGRKGFAHGVSTQYRIHGNNNWYGTDTRERSLALKNDLLKLNDRYNRAKPSLRLRLKALLQGVHAWHRLRLANSASIQILPLVACVVVSKAWRTHLAHRIKRSEAK